MEQIRSFNIVDIIALIIILLGSIRGLIRGLSAEIAGFISTITALCMGLYFFRPFGSWFLENTRLTKWSAHAVAFVVTIIAAIIAMALLRSAMKYIIKIVVNPKADRLGGLIAGFISSSIIIIIIFMTVNMLNDKYWNRIFKEKSFIGSMVGNCIPPLEEIEEMAKELQAEVQ